VRRIGSAETKDTKIEEYDSIMIYNYAAGRLSGLLNPLRNYCGENVTADSLTRERA
jgi:hypothetical protein